MTLKVNESMKVDYLSNLDWDAQHADTRYMTHGFHQYTSKYIPQIPSNLISRLSNTNDLVLDNFMGSGTTLVECKLLRRNSIGVDVNPLACLVSKVKSTNFSDRELQNILKVCHLIKRNIDCIRNHNKGVNNNRIRGNNVMNKQFREQGYQNFLSSNIPHSLLKTTPQNIPHSNILKWFNDNVICELLIIKSEVDCTEDDNSRDFLLVAFSSILRNLSNAHEGFGNLMRNKHPSIKYGIYEKFCHAVKRMIKGMWEFNKGVAQNSIIASNSITAKIVRGDSRNLNFIDSKSIDLICSHPPYMSAVPYAEYQKLSLWWLGYSPREIEKETIGGRRTSTDAPVRFLDDMRLVISETKRVLKPKKYCCIIVGNPTYAGKKIQLNEFIKKEAKNIGFYLVNEIPRTKYRLTTGKIKEEFILIFKNE